jgi:hypothetical protein
MDPQIVFKYTITKSKLTLAIHKIAHFNETASFLNSIETLNANSKKERKM